MVSSGFQADVKALQKQPAAKHLVSFQRHGWDLSAPAQQANELPRNGSITFKHPLLQAFLFLFNVLGGLDNEGKGCVFTYDAVGSYERVGYGTQGTGSTLIMSFLDNQLKSSSPLLLPAQDAVTPLSESEAADLVNCFCISN
ncbi:hypothetical protein REPUB_Repub16aG0048800 [Reevesia pubescens]